MKYVGKDLVALRNGKIYDVISVEKGWYRIMTEIGEDYLFPPNAFTRIHNQPRKLTTFRVKNQAYNWVSATAALIPGLHLPGLPRKKKRSLKK